MCGNECFVCINSLNSISMAGETLLSEKLNNSLKVAKLMNLSNVTPDLYLLVNFLYI
jgi:hypothetical protein